MRSRGVFDAPVDVQRGPLGVHRQGADVVGDHGEAESVLAAAGGFDPGVEREDQ
jgi:hypothetical protein